eukprot:scaffold155_cov347-Pavlova_lutheri.AAC.72
MAELNGVGTGAHDHHGADVILHHLLPSWTSRGGGRRETGMESRIARVALTKHAPPVPAEKEADPTLSQPGT